MALGFTCSSSRCFSCKVRLLSCSVILATSNTDSKNSRLCRCVNSAVAGPGKLGCVPCEEEGVGGANACVQPLGVIISPRVGGLCMSSQP